MLHIQTPLYRYENLEKIYDSIPKYGDIVWHISKIKSRETPDSPIWDDKRVILYDIDCEDTDTVAKRNTAFANMKEGWFHMLDDDTTFHPNMYGAYLRMIKGSFKGMLVGSQNDHEGKLRLRPSFPRSGYISIRKRIYTLIFGSSGTGKSSLANCLYILNPFDWYWKNRHNTNIKLKIVYFSMERSSVYVTAKWLVRKIFLNEGILLPLPKFKCKAKFRDYDSNVE